MSWEPEDNIPPELVQEMQQQQPHLFKGLAAVGGEKKRKKSKSRQGSKQQQPLAIKAEQAHSSLVSVISEDSATGHTGHNSNLAASSGKHLDQKQHEQVAVGSSATR